MSLITCQRISKTFGMRPLFENVSFTIAEGERVGLIGPNGAGKSTLAQILAGLQTPDSGTLAFRKGLRLGYVPQEPSFGTDVSVRSVVQKALEGENLDEAGKEGKLHVTLGRLGFEDFDAPAATLSGGWRKRLALAREIVRELDVLLLDEPTNHLDLDGIVWLERYLSSSRFACLVVTHDRYFLENMATDMAEINRIYPDGIYRVRGGYSEFLLKREEWREAQAKQRESLENKVRREIEWLRRGPKARTTKSKARIDQAGEMIGELGAMQSRSATSQANIDFTASGRQTKKLLTLKGVSKELGGRELFRDVGFTLTPGTRMGLVGPNGSGKTTMLRLIAGRLEPDAGTIERAENLRIVYFDQHREQLDPKLSLRRALCPHGDSVIFRDRTIHVVSWAQRFLFRAEQLDVAVERLSGGERARVAIARLMLEPADLLMLDEPTNDLDIPTLEVLEESLLEFPGALVLVTHDRYLLDRVSTFVLALERGTFGLFADYSQWEQAREQAEKKPVDSKGKEAPKADAPAGRKRLSYMEAREWDTIEQKIHDAEATLQAKQEEMHSSEVSRDALRLARIYREVEETQALIDTLYQRWGELGAKQGF